MKNTWPYFFILFLYANVNAGTDTALRRSNSFLRFFAQQRGLTHYALETLIGKRCSRYLPINKISDCQKAVTKMIELLDYDVLIFDKKRTHSFNETWDPKSFIFVAFKTKLKKLLSDPATTAYLEELNQELYRFLLEEIEHLSIWDLTKRHFKTDHKTAMALAVLFQDTSLNKLHLAYLDKAHITGNAHFVHNKELLSRVIAAINLILDVSEKNYQAIFYPQALQESLNRNIYHFYVPLYLAKELTAAKVHPDSAYAATLMLTLTYEFITASNDYRYLFSDPQTVSSTYKIQDIYGGYCGSNIGVRGMSFNKSFLQIQESFLRSTEDSVQLLLRH